MQPKIIKKEYKVKDNKVVFTEENVKSFLDFVIKYWREQLKDDDDSATYYIDAFQSVRVSLFGEFLEK